MIPTITIPPDLKIDCSDALTYFGSQESDVKLYRIVGGSEHPVITKTRIRTDRQPLDSTPTQTAVFNDAYQIAHGVEDVRNKVLFTGSSLETVKEYRHYYRQFQTRVVIPTNQCHIINTKLRDSIVLLTHISKVFSQFPTEKMRTSKEYLDLLIKEIVPLVRRDFGPPKSVTEGLQEVDPHQEVWIMGPEVWSINANYISSGTNIVDWIIEHS